MPITSASVTAQRSYRATVTFIAEQQSLMKRFWGSEEDDSCAFPEFTQASGQKGTSHQVRFQDREFDGPTANDDVIGQETDEVTLTDTITMKLVHVTGKIENVYTEQQEVNYDVRALKLDRMGKDWAETWDRWTIRQLSGFQRFNTADRHRKTGCNAVPAYDAGHIKYLPINGTNTTSALVAADTSAIMSGSTIDWLETYAQSKDYLGYRMVPCKTPFGDYYVLLVNAEGFNQLKANTSETRIFQIELAKIQGSKDPMSNVLIRSQPFIYSSTLVLRSDYIEAADDAAGTAAQANTRTAIFFGAKAMGRMYGAQFRGGDHVRYTEHWQHSRLSLQSSTLAGFKRLVPQPEAPVGTAKTFGSIAVVHYTRI